MIFEEFDKFQCLENANRIFAAVTNDWGETAVVAKNNVSVFRENRDFNSCLKHFLFDQTIIDIEQCPIVSKIGNYLDVNMYKIVENFDAFELFEAVIDISATPTISLANKIVEIPLTVYWMDRDYLIILTNVGNVQIFRKSNNEWCFHSNLADIYLAHMQSIEPEIDVDQHQCLKTTLNQLVFTAACSLHYDNKYMLFIGSRNGEISLWDCDSEDMATISFVKTFTSYENERITCMETYSVNSNDMILLVGYLNGNLIYYHTNVSCRNFDQFSIVHDDRDMIAVNFIKLIAVNVILAAKNNYLLIVKISFDTTIICDTEFIKVSSDAISGILDLKDRIIISSRFGTCKSLDPVTFSLSNFDSSFLITENPDRRTCNINGMFSTRNQILGIILDDQTSKKGLQLMPILKNKQLDDPIAYLCDVSLRVNRFDHYFDLLELCRYYCCKNPVVVSDFISRKQPFQKFNVVQLSFHLRILKLHESALLPEERSKLPISSMELQNGLVAKYAFQLLRDLMDHSSNLILTQSRRACISYLTYFLSLSYQSKFVDDYTVSEIENLLFTAMTSDDLVAEDVSVKCLFCSGDFVFGIYCENFHPTQICVCSLVPFVNFFSKVYCPSCKFLVNEDFYDSFENKDDLVCCFCQVTVCKY